MRARLGIGWLAVALTGVVAVGCTRNDPNQLIGGGGSCTETTTTTGTGSHKTTSSTTAVSSSGATTTAASTGAGGAGGAGGSPGTGVPSGTVLDDRVLDYNEALRTASFKLVGAPPTLQQILDLKAATAPATAYAALIDQMLQDARFAARMVAFWQNTMRMGGAAASPKPSRDTGPTFAARIVFEGRPYTDLFTATTHTCPTFDGKVFADGECNNNAPVVAGILTDPGAHSQYFGNLSFRRHRFFQEVFVCRTQPAELSPTPKPMGAGSYTSPWPFESIAGTDNGGRINFHDTTSAICANCHSTANHRAPLFSNFDANGMYNGAAYQVNVPVSGTPPALISDWLPQMPTPEPFAWKFGVPVKDLGEMGAAMAKDDEVLNCAVKRMWNYAMSKGDIVNDAADVPDSVVASFTTEFKGNSYNLREVLRSMLVSPDFVRF